MRSPERDLFLPVFIISFNRGDYLTQILDSYIKQDVDLDFVIHDNGSTEPRTLEALSELSAAGFKVYRYGPISAPDELNLVDLSVQRYRAESGYFGPYAVTDCDVDLSEARGDALRTYLELLQQFPDVECVGPMLRIADIPRSYPLFNRVMERHVAQFWHRQPEWVEISTGRIAYLRHAIDTTLAVHRAGSSFRRLKSGLRVYHPFEAKHLDWYMSPRDASEYQLSSSPLISHWDNAAELAKYRSQPDAVFIYTLVEGEVGSLRTVTRSTLDHPS